MPSKWAKSSSRAFGRRARFAVAALIAASPAAAWATVTVTPVSPYVLSSGDIAYYAAGIADTTRVDTVSGFTNYSVTANTGEGYLGPNRLLFDVRTDKTFTPQSNQTLVVMVLVSGTSGNTVLKAIPITSIGDSACQNGGPCQGDLVTGGTVNYKLAARVANTPNVNFRVGIYPWEICDALRLQGTSAPAGCAADWSVVTPIPGTPAKFSVRFVMLLAPTDGTLLPANPSADSEDHKDITINIQGSQPVYSCPNLANAYFPSDGSILFNSSAVSSSAVTGGAPVTHVIVVAKKGTGVNLTAPFGGSNDIIVAVPVNTSEYTVSGFSNTTDGSDNKYELGFLVRDAAGVYPNIDSSCIIDGVQTAAVEGFLTKNSCFIATATYDSTEAAPVRMLREFRDTVLIRYDFGRAFVHWYYSWSPGAADWLREHVWLRSAVLMALTPVQALAWLALHPLVVALWGVVSMVVLFGSWLAAIRAVRP